MFSYALSLVLLPLVFATVHDIQVGADGLTFTPSAIGADVGDQVVFHFNPKNHSVVQSSFASPCGPLDGGLNTGFHPVPSNQTSNLPTFTFVVNDTTPFWAYCSQGAGTPASHCGQGMVFAVNCGADGTANSFTNFENSALQVGASLSAAAAAASSTPATGVATAAYGSITIPPAPTPSLVTDTITLESSTWTTTYSSYPNSPAATPASLTGQVITVIVGGPGNLTFSPSHVSAQPRDTIVFEFHQKNHTVTQSSFADPCRPLDANGTTGFDSGFEPVADNSTVFPTWNYTVVDTSPVWAYCRQVSHCGSGMVFAINSDETSARNFSAFQTLAEQLNGTSTTASATSSTPSQSSTNGALPTLHTSRVLTLVFAALAIFMLL